MEIFKNNICTCTADSLDDEEYITIKLSNQYNKLQIEERNCINIAIYECDLWFRSKDITKYSVEFDNDSNELIAVAKLSRPLRKDFTKEAKAIHEGKSKESGISS